MTGFDFIKLLNLLLVFGKTSLSRLCRPISDATDFKSVVVLIRALRVK